MNRRLVANLLGRFALFFTLCVIPPAILGLNDPDTGPIAGESGFVAMAVVGALLGTVLLVLGRGAGRDFFRREGLLVVGASWVIAGILGAVPFVASGAMSDPIDAFFESISGLTTTGASVLGSEGHYAIEALPRSLLLWRSELQWMGGLGVILMFVVLLPAFGVSPSILVSSEQVGPSDPSTRPRMVQRARLLFTIYVVLTALEILLLWGAADMSIFDAVCHALTTLPSGGFSPRNASIGAYESAIVEGIVILFMIFAGTNFLLFRNLVAGGGDGRSPFRDPEFRLYIGLIVGGTLVTAVMLWMWGGTAPDIGPRGIRDYSEIDTCVRDAAFNVVSTLTCTGYATANFQCWPKPAVLLLLFFMFVGGSTGSTSGGIKVHRLLVVAKVVVARVHDFLRPRAVHVVRVGGRVVESPQLTAMLALVLIWLGSSALGTFVLSIDPRIDLLSALSANLTCLGCVGPGLTAVVEHPGGFEIANAGGLDLGPHGSFGGLHDYAKIFLCAQMVFGRLEFLGPIVLLMPGFWRRR